MAGIAFSPRYTVHDYLTWEGDWELWDGVAVSMSPSPNRRHQAVARRLVVAEFELHADCRIAIDPPALW